MRGGEKTFSKIIICNIQHHFPLQMKNIPTHRNEQVILILILFYLVYLFTTETYFCFRC
jgi:hypothetical protein